MSRTTATALALVNWKGVFYARYALDRHVTALEGANGAGKTTVMIAAYVVLLPDMSRLRFTNLGETGATGGDKGIWGRLGEQGRPSYAVLDFALPNKCRLVAGVHLERKGEPAVEPTPFIVYGLETDVRLQDLLLLKQGDEEGVPELPELRESAVRLGGRLQTFASAREYFAALFEQGVTPMRLGTDEERNKLNEMLRTSMTGGISRALTSELRSFLLKEEGGLADTLQRMRANLDACRRTRTEVMQAHRLEEEIGGVFAAGQTMFAAAFFATREQAEELTRRVEEAEAAKLDAEAAHGCAKEALAQTLAALEALERRRGDIGQLLEAARTWQARLREALAAAQRLAACTVKLTAAQNKAQHLGAQRDAAEAARGTARQAQRRADEDYTRAAAGLADLQQGLEELHRRADAYRQTTRRLGEAETCLSTVPIAVNTFSARLAGAGNELTQVDTERRETTTRLDDAAAQRQLYLKVLAALQCLVGEVAAEEAYDKALTALQEHRTQVELAGRHPALTRELADALAQAKRQAAVQKRAQALEVVVGEGSAVRCVEQLLNDAEKQLSDHEESGRSATALAQQSERDVKQWEARHRALSDREPLYRASNLRAVRIGAYLSAEVNDRSTLDAARVTLAQHYSTAQQAERETSAEHEALLLQARDLLAQGGPVDPTLLQLRDQLGADLVAQSFEDVELTEAGRIEARLGPLAQALVVDDPLTTARTLAQRPDGLATVLLVARNTDLSQLAATPNEVAVGDQDIAVTDGVALRVSRIPTQPQLGRRAREARAAELQAQAERQAHRLDEIRTQRRQLERLVADGEALLAGHAVWLAGDPAPELETVAQARAAAQKQLKEARADAERHATAGRAQQPRVRGLRVLLGEALLLDPPDHAARAQALQSAVDAAQRAKVQVTQMGASADCVDRHQAVLRQPPLSDADIARLRERVQHLTQQRERLREGIDALTYVQGHVEALGWEDAPARLSQEQALVPAIKQQLSQAAQHRDTCVRAANEAETQFDATLCAFQDADGSRRAEAQAHAQALAHFAQLSIAEPTAAALALADRDVARLSAEHSSHDEKHAQLLTRKGREEGHVGETARRLRDAEEKLTKGLSEATPAVKRWEHLHARATQAGVIGTLLTEIPEELTEVHGHVNFVQVANTRRELLMERLRSAQGGTQLLAEINSVGAPLRGEFAANLFDLWLLVRNWLRRRLPAQIAEVDDPLEALLRLRDQLQSLQERLKSQEVVLRGASEDLARGIDVQIRKARTQVSRLNKNLEGLSFGSIKGIRVRQSTVERMEQVLRALRDGSAQTLLFQAEIPIEEALAQIFQRFGGGRTGGQRLLDYREYVQLLVQIRRKGSTDWESANPSRLSTGEAIGIGAALMMVVLTEWERDATFLRAKKTHGSLRFLFLDEANRLSHDNLGVLFDLCQTLDLQLLIAAPEVATAEGNTTYRLVRNVTGDGREEVLISGRRTRSNA
jgi:chromosome partition protein MukB